ncbi:MAG TPA: hypothetical protein VK473_10705 [Terriglobales bacterium]|nr:hypothetical protein [Terriglobales bacterium]
MKRLTALLLLLGLWALAGWAQDMPKVSKYVWVEHVQLNPGKGPTFTKYVSQLKEAVDANSPDLTWIAGTPMTGDMAGFTFITFHDSFQDMENFDKSFDKVQRAAMVKNVALLNEASESERMAHAEMYKYREDLSYNPGKVTGPQTTHWRVTVYHIKPGMTSKFTDLIKEVVSIRKTGNIDDTWIAYQAVAGVPNNTFVSVVPLKSLADMDVDRTAAMDAVYTPAVKRSLDAMAAEAIQSSETNIMTASPGMSRPPKTYVAANPDFWTVKPDELQAAATKTTAKSKSKLKEAAMKEEKKQ